MGDIKKSGFISPNLVLLERRLIPTASMFYRKDQSKMPDFFRNCPVGDRPLRLWLLSKGDIYYFANPMIMYREQSNGSFGQRVCSSFKYAKDIYDGMIAFYNNYNEFTKYKYNKEIQYFWIAPNTKIMKGAIIKDGAIIGSDTTISKEIPTNSLAIGRPAKIIRTNIRWSREALF